MNTVAPNRASYTRHFELLHDLGTVKGANGVVGAASELELRQVEDGVSNTIWVGEKYIPASLYDTGASEGNDQGWDCGYDVDNVRWTVDSPKPDEWVDRLGGINTLRSSQVFGSAHATGCQFVYLDGSGHTISYDVDPVVFHTLGNRSDGEVTAAATP